MISLLVTPERREMDKEENNLLVEVVCGRCMFGAIIEDDGGVRYGQKGVKVRLVNIKECSSNLYCGALVDIDVSVIICNSVNRLDFRGVNRITRKN